MTLALLEQSFAAGWTPDPDLKVSEWADTYRMLSQKAASEPGPWRTARTPYLREIMDSLSPSSPIQRVVFMAGAQVGKTEAGSNWLGYIIHSAPGPAMLVQPTVDTAKRLSKQRIAPMIEETPALRDKVQSPRARDSGNTMMVKEFPGGVMILTGANSAVGLRSMPVRYLFCDEVDAYPSDVEGEGDPVNLAERRTTTFARRKIYLTSTPTIKDLSRIEREYLASDQRRYFVPCPECGAFQWLKWSGLKWSDDDPTTAAYACEGCGCLIPEHRKSEMLTQGEWRATAPFDGKTAGFHLSSLYSPVGWKSWEEIVAEFLKAKGDPPLLKTWVNTVLGETWEDEYSNRLGAGELADRAELYEPGVAPAQVLVITAGVDTQDNRLAITIKGWGRDEESWLIDYLEIYGDPSRPEIWRELDAILLKREIQHEIAEPMKIMATCIDSGGHFTHEVYQYARERHAFHIMAIKGQSQRGKPVIGKPTKVDVNYRGKTAKKGAEVWPVGSDTAKSTIYARLKLTEPGPGFIHFHADTPPGYFEQLTSEKQITRYLRGFPIRDWVKKPGARNEALDCEVYGYAALQSLYMRFNRRTIWDKFENELKLKNKAQKAGTTPNSGKQAAPRQPKNFATDW